MQFVAKLADIGDPQRERRRTRDDQFPRCREGKRRIGDVVPRQRLQNLA